MLPAVEIETEVPTDKAPGGIITLVPASESVAETESPSESLRTVPMSALVCLAVSLYFIFD